MPPTTCSASENAGHRARRQEAGLGADHDLIALQLAQRRADAALRPLVAVVDGGIEQVDAAFARGDQRVGVCLVGRIVVGAQIRADTQARNLQARGRVR